MFSSKPSKIGIIGLGIIGSRIAEVLRSADYHVYVWSRTPKPEPNFMSSPAEVAELAEFIQIFVRNGDDLLEVIEKMKGALTKKHVVINNATVNLEATKKAGALVTETGAAFLDAPFTGSRLAAEGGKLVYYVSGDPSVVAKARPLLEASSKEILDFGGNIGDATVLKIVTNMISATTVEILVEALAVATSQGIAGEKLGEAIKRNACNSPLIEMKLPTILANDYLPHFALKNMFKDAQFGLGLANDAGIDLPALSTVASVMFNTIRKGRGEEDFSVIAANYAGDAGDADSARTPESERAEAAGKGE